MGNSRQVYRKILKDLLPTDYKLTVIGRHWENYPVQEYVVQPYISNEEVGQAYYDATILLNDHWDDMKEQGVISNRIFDALAAGAFVISDYMDEIEEATMKVVVGSEKKSRKISEKDKKITAYHEAGHAISSYYLENQDPVTHISIVPRGMAAGFTLYTPEKDNAHMLKSRMLDDIVSLLGGRVAEQIIFNDISTGASNDIQRATETARNMITKYGMSEKLGPIAFGSDNDEVFLGKNYTHTRNYSETVAAAIDEEVENIINNAYKRTEAILKEHIDQLHLVSDALIKLEKIDREQFESLMTTGALPQEKVEETEEILVEETVENTESTESDENM